MLSLILWFAVGIGVYLAVAKVIGMVLGLTNETTTIRETYEADERD